MPVENIDLLDAMADQIAAAIFPATTHSMQVIPRMVSTPTPPCIDMYPGDIARGTDAAAFGMEGEFLFTVRARVGDNDEEGNQDLLLAFMDDYNALSVPMALLADPTLGGLASSLDIIDPTGFVVYPFGSESLVGFQFTARVIRAES